MNDRAQPVAGLDRILVIKLADIGDAILATPALAALRETYPAARIDVLTTTNGALAFRLCPALDQVVVLDKQAFDAPGGFLHPLHAARLSRVFGHLRSARYDAVLLLQHLTTSLGARKYRWLCTMIGAPICVGLDNGRGGFLTHRAIDYGFGVKAVYEYNLDVVAQLGARIEHARPSFAVPEHDRSSASQLLEARGVTGPFVVLHPSVGAYSSARNWSIERFGEVAHTIRTQTRHQVLLVGADDASDAAQRISRDSTVVNLVGATSFSELAALVIESRLVIGSDSSVTHLAAATATPTLAIFGPSNHNAWKPFQAQILTAETPETPSSSVVVIRSSISCSPCFYTGYSLGRREGCPLRTCLDQVSANRVTQIALDLLQRESPS